MTHPQADGRPTARRPWRSDFCTAFGMSGGDDSGLRLFARLLEARPWPWPWPPELLLPDGRCDFPDLLEPLEEEEVVGRLNLLELLEEDEVVELSLRCRSAVMTFLSCSRRDALDRRSRLLLLLLWELLLLLPLVGRRDPPPLGSPAAELLMGATSPPMLRRHQLNHCTAVYVCSCMYI